MPRIVVLDGQTLNPGDLDWSEIERLGECSVYPRTEAADIVRRASGADCILTNKTPISANTLRQLPALRYIGVTATGYNIVDVAAARAQGVVVTNVRNYSTPSVAQTTFALILALSNRVELHSEAVHAGEWASCPDFTFSKTPLVDLAGRTLAIVGYGEIGRAVAAIGRAFGMRIAALTRTSRPLDGAESFASLDELAAIADVLSLHCPLTDATRKMIDAPLLAKMKRDAYLINTARGPLVDEPALADALRTRRIAGAGLDVLDREPPAEGSPLFGLDNCIITPHNAWASQASRRRLMAAVAGNLSAFLSGQPVNVVTS